LVSQQVTRRRAVRGKKEKETNIITVAIEKGGVAKTTTVCNLAASYAQLGKRVLVVDMDHQGNTSDLLGVSEQAAAESKHVSRAIREKLPLSEVRLPGNLDGLDVVAADSSLKKLKSEKEGSALQHLLLKPLFETDALRDYDIVLIDTHPSIDCLVLSALVASHYYLIPSFAEASSIKGIAEMINFVSEIRDLNPMLMLLGVVVANFDKNIATHVRFERVLRDFGEQANYRVFKTVIPHSASVKAADSANKVLLRLMRRASPVTVAYSTLAGEILPLLKGKRLGKVPTPKAGVLEKAAAEFEVMGEAYF
jgi:chromosome partitioning protein